MRTHGALAVRRDRRAVAARCQDLLAQLALPPRFSVAGFCRAVETVTRRPIVLHPQAPGWGPPGVCGVLASTASADHVFYTEDGSRIGQATTIVHECGHILVGQYSPASATAGGDLYLHVVRDVVPATTIARLRGRSSFTDQEERIVETFASIVLRSGLSGAWDKPRAPGARLADRFG